MVSAIQHRSALIQHLEGSAPTKASSSRPALEAAAAAPVRRGQVLGEGRAGRCHTSRPSSPRICAGAHMCTQLSEAWSGEGCRSSKGSRAACRCAAAAAAVHQRQQQVPPTPRRPPPLDSLVFGLHAVSIPWLFSTSIPKTRRRHRYARQDARRSRRTCKTAARRGGSGSPWLLP